MINICYLSFYSGVTNTQQLHKRTKNKDRNKKKTKNTIQIPQNNVSDQNELNTLTSVTATTTTTISVTLITEGESQVITNEIISGHSRDTN